jgi:hypothetical protein
MGRGSRHVYPDQTDQATVLGAPLDQPRTHEASLARRGPGDAISLSRSPDPFAVGGHPNMPGHHSTGNRRCMKPASRSATASPVESRMLGNGHVPTPARLCRDWRRGRAGAGSRAARPRVRARRCGRGAAGAARSGAGSRLGGQPAELDADVGTRPGPPAGRAVDDAEQRPDRNWRRPSGPGWSAAAAACWTRPRCMTP